MNGIAAFRRGLACLCVSSLAAGCSIGGLASFGPIAAAPPPAPAAPAPVAYGSFLEGPAGQKLNQDDRDKALAAEQDALISGQRKTWRGAPGTYGFVVPGDVVPGEPGAGATPDEVGATCRPFTSTVYVGGRPTVGHGRGCQTQDGSYRIVG